MLIHDAHRGNHEIPSFRYWITLENEDGRVDDIGLILVKDSTLPLYRAHQQLEELLENDESDEVTQGQQQHIERIQTRYNHVVQALGEITPDVQRDESIPEPLPNDDG